MQGMPTFMAKVSRSRRIWMNSFTIMANSREKENQRPLIIILPRRGQQGGERTSLQRAVLADWPDARAQVLLQLSLVEHGLWSQAEGATISTPG